MKMAEMFSLREFTGYAMPDYVCNERIREAVYMNIVGFHNENFTKNPVTTLSVPYKLEG
jgi:hypothetical protein